MGPQAPVLAVFLAAALLCLGAAAALPRSVAGRFAMEGLTVDKGIDHFLVLTAAFVMYIFR
ncbi:hypothetical protein GQ55_5G180100 [Panicum hallii var. hallii]|uniref:Uncharacterized protein n=2 Tax=Panicum hallii TaxID=206008 RepID=A0A2T7DHJ3_9POAL|nr:hypothetical protein PAHAL_5G180200 [Panicum hallii]PUZ55036.1 hypothetical protein GQ55_5G180100 [Panicum hallii var. hallii]